MRIINWLTVLAIICLTGCGYHLRGDVALPEGLRHAYLEGASIALRERIGNLLRRDAGQLVDSPEQAGVVIKVYGEQSSRRVLSLSARGRSNELELYYRFEYALYRADHTELLARQALEIKREYFNNQEQIIAKANEETVIRGEMLQQAAQAIVDRARVVLTAHAE